jgi:hypothetical protein
MKTVDEIAAELELVEDDRNVESIALTMIRCLDYDRSLTLDDAAYQERVRDILAAMDRVRLANVRAALVSIDSDEWDEYASPVPMPGSIG